MKDTIKGLAVLALAALFGATPATASAQAATAASPALESRASDVLALFRGEAAPSDIFSAVFLAAVPPAQLGMVIDRMTGQFGAPVAVESVTPIGPASATIALRFEKAIVRGPMQLDAEGKIAGLLLNDITPVADSAEAILEELRALPGVANAWFGPLDGGEALLAHNADRPLALGSTFKLFVLSALSQAIARGEYDWDDVVRVDARSFPSGVMQDWPEGAPVTVQTLATLMIQISDNTATDALIRLLGREAVEAEMRAAGVTAEQNFPFLTTRELFVLKADPALRDAWLAEDGAGRRAMLANVATREIDQQAVAAAMSGTPVAIDTLEWFASPEALRALMQGLTGPEHETARAILAANPSMGEAARERWAYVGYKGGSEPGVLNLTWLLRDKAGDWHLLTLGWNNAEAAVAQDRLELLVLRVLALAQGAAAP